MNILNALKQLRDDIKAWVTVNLNALNTKIDEKTFPIDSKLDDTSTNPVQNKAITKEIDSINDRVGDIPVATQISTAIDKVPTFSGDYNDLTNAPDITEDGSGNMIIADESGNIIFKADAEGIHTTAVSLNGEAAATEKYVDETVANIDIPEVDFTGYATEDYVDNKVADLVNSAPEALNTLGELAAALENHEDAYDALLTTVGGKATHADLENLKDEISESIVSETDEFHIVDESGNIVASIDENGITTTTVTAKSVIVNGDNVEEHIDNSSIHVTATEKASWNNKSNFSGSYTDLTNKPDLDNYYTKSEVDTAIDNIEIPEVDLTNYYTMVETNTAIESVKEELSESIVAKTDEWKVVDEAGNIIFSVDATGAHTTALTLNGESVEDIVDERVAALVDSAPDTLNTLNELANALGDDPNFATTVATEIGKKVDKVDGKGLSTNDFTDEYKTKLDQFNPDSGIMEETDPTVPAWAKEATKPTYTADEVGALSKNTPLFSGDYNDLENAPDISEDDSGDLVIADKDGNIIFRSNGSGFETVNLAVQNITIDGKTIQEMIQEYVNSYLNT